MVKNTMCKACGLKWAVCRILFPALCASMVAAGQRKQPEPIGPLFLVTNNGSVGYADSAGNLAIAAAWPLAGHFFEGMAYAQKPADKFGYINKRGQWAIKPGFDAAGDFSEGKARVQKGGKWGYINQQGSWVIPAQFSLCYDFSGGYAMAVAGGKWGIIDTTGQWVVMPQHYDITQPWQDWYAFKKSLQDAWQLACLRPAAIAGQRWGRVKNFGHGLAPARHEDGRYGFVDTTGQWKLPAAYKQAEPFSEGLAAVQGDDGQWGYINGTGLWVVAPRFSKAGLFRQGYALVETASGIGYINNKGQLLFERPR